MYGLSQIGGGQIGGGQVADGQGKLSRLPYAVTAVLIALVWASGSHATNVPATPPASNNNSVSTLDSGSALQLMAPGWNLGNTLEAIGSGATPASTSQETAWGNPVVTQALMDSVKAAGFKSVRIPVAWSEYAGADYTISPKWMARVTEVVNYARNSGLYVVINVHWDGGWIQPTAAQEIMVNAKLAAFWTQIATNFKDYDDHLLFAGTNEIAVKDVYSAPTPENCAAQNSFNQTFVNAVRATGGHNATRFLVVQGYNTNIDYTIGCNATLPSDTAAGKLMMEVHDYDPYDFTLNTGNAIWQWGDKATKASATQTWANEGFTDGQFQKLKTTFVDKGVPVILGEYAASLRSDYDPKGTYRNYWDQYLTHAAYSHGVIPMYWDNGYTSNHNSGLFDRGAAKPSFPDTIAAIVNAAK